MFNPFHKSSGRAEDSRRTSRFHLGSTEVLVDCSRLRTTSRPSALQRSQRRRWKQATYGPELPEL